MPEMNIIGFAGFKEESEDVYLYQCPLCKSVAYNINADTRCNCGGQEVKHIIVSKQNWADFSKGVTNKLRAYDINELHHEFGDYPEEHILRITVSVAKGE